MQRIFKEQFATHEIYYVAIFARRKVPAQSAVSAREGENREPLGGGKGHTYEINAAA